MERKSYYQTIWSTLQDSLNFSGKASRTEYSYYVLFHVSCILLYMTLSTILLIGKGESIDYYLGRADNETNPFLLMLFNCYFLFMLWITFSTIALTFRRCRDIGHTMLGIVQFVPILNIILIPILMLKKGI